MKELKPCPFCGGEAEIEQIPSATFDKFAPHCKKENVLRFTLDIVMKEYTTQGQQLVKHGTEGQVSRNDKKLYH